MSEKPFAYGPNNPHPLSQVRTELVWEGKYDEYGRRRELNVAELAMPMQRIETVDEPRSRAEAAGQLPLWEKTKNKAQEKEGEYAAWRNRLIWGDNKLVMASLLKELKGRIDLIYIDPPFDVGADFTMDVPVGDGKETVGKDQSTLEMVAYRDMWGKGTDSYLQMIFERLSLMKELLSEQGSIVLHCDQTMGHFLKILLDDVFSAEHFQNEIVWRYVKYQMRGMSHLTSNWDRLFWYSRRQRGFTFNLPTIPDYRLGAGKARAECKAVEKGSLELLAYVTAAGGGAYAFLKDYDKLRANSLLLVKDVKKGCGKLKRAIEGKIKKPQKKSGQKPSRK